MFRITIQQFKKIEEFEASFPSTGVVLLDGPTGIGKTSVLEAISFCLFDNIGTSYDNKKTVGRKKQKVMVELQFPNGMIVTRTKNPSGLKVVTRRETIEDEKTPAAAQGYIDALFGGETLWRVGGYIRQDSLSDFFVMERSERLSLIQGLIHSERGVEGYLSTVQEKLTIETERIKRLQGQIKTYSDLYMELYRQNAERLAGKQERVEETIEEQLSKGEKDHREEVKRLEEQIEHERGRLARAEENERSRRYLLELLDSLKSQLTNNREEELAALVQRRRELTEQLSAARRSKKRDGLLLSLSQLEKRLGELPIDNEPTMTIQEIGRVERILSGPTEQEIRGQEEGIREELRYREQLLLYSRRVDLTRAIEGERSLLSSLPDCSVAGELEEVKRRIWSLRTKSLTCPCCSTVLFLNGDVLTQLPLETESLPRLLTEERRLEDHQRLHLERPRRELELTRLEKQLDALERVPEEFIVRPITKESPAQLSGALQLLQRQKKELSTVPEGVVPETERRRLSMKEERGRLVKEAEEIKRQLEGLNGADVVVDTSSLEREISSIDVEEAALRRHETQRIAVEARVKQTEQQLELLPVLSCDEQLLRLTERRREEEKLRWETTKEDLLDQMEFAKMRDLKEKHDSLFAENEEACRRAAAFEKIKATMKNAEHLLLEELLVQLNRTISNIVDELFHLPTTLTIKSVKENKTNDRLRPEVNYEISVDGLVTDRVTKLISGGERSRLSLALTLAFSQFTSAPFLLLDESLSTLNADVKENTMETVKRYAEGKVVITVNHDTTTGVYDDFISMK